jgi:antitoxin VapB
MSGNAAKAKIFQNGRSQAVRIPAEYRFSSNEVYIQRDPHSGVITLSEKPFRPSAEQIFRAFDEAGAQDFEVERDKTPHIERDLF